MKNLLQESAFSTPGRVCLFGEHQDYLDLPVIPCAISLRIKLEGTRRKDGMVHIDLPDIGSHVSFSLEGSLAYILERDYFRSSVNVLRKHGYTFSSGFDCVVHGEIPINSGTSSSSALIVTWINFLATMSDQAEQLPAIVAAQYAHEAEVLEFGEPGGMMDHYSTALGGVLFLKFFPKVHVEALNPPLTTFVLGDSKEPKDTRGILARVKERVIRVSRELSEHHPGFSLQSTTYEALEQYRPELLSDEFDLLKGTIKNRDITLKAKQVLTAGKINHREFGALLSQHQAILRDVLRISTPKIDRMLEAGIAAGAYGGKINGSGGGGCMFVYAPEYPERVAEAIEHVGGKAYVVHVDSGTKCEIMEEVQ